MKIRSHRVKEILYGVRESSTKMSIRKWCNVFSEGSFICKAKGAGRGRGTEAKLKFEWLLLVVQDIQRVKLL